jgi:hypothetical protein
MRVLGCLRFLLRLRRQAGEPSLLFGEPECPLPANIEILPTRTGAPRAVLKVLPTE